MSIARPTSCRSTSSAVRVGLVTALVAVAPLPGRLVAQSAARPGRKELRAIRIEGPAPRIDGRLNDTAWRRAEFVSDFVEKEPDEGITPTEKTEVGFLYDNDALYVGARMYSHEPGTVRARMARRDHTGGSEQIIVSLDTYLDRRTAYSFGLTAAGVRLDYYHPEDDEHERDYSFDAVWEGKSAIDSAGWTAEIRIPFAQLRFNSKPVQVWGVNLTRSIPARNEDVYWVLIPRDENGWASRFGDLVGIEGIRTSRHVELVPYAASNASFRGSREPANPFDTRRDLSVRMGGDVKAGLGPNLTLDATVNPDFGQIEADPAVVNLSAFEISFDEQRPFFTEGRQLFEGNGPTYFYSRRIGAQPAGEADSGFVDVPVSTTILGAAKLTGRLESGLSIGALTALTSPEDARTFYEDSGTFGRQRVQPLTGFAVVRAQQEFGASKSTAGVIFTGVRRDLSPDEPLAAALDRQAYSGGGDWDLRFQGGRYELSGYLGFSYVQGDTAAILNIQRSSARYFQRPDAGYVTLDPSRTSLLGYTGQLEFNRQSGRHWLWSASGSATSPSFELNDAGFLQKADEIKAKGEVEYRETAPGPLFREYSIGLSGSDWWNFGGVRTSTSADLSLGATWRNYWSTSLDFEYEPRGLSDDLTRGGPLMGTGAGWTLGARLSSDPAKRTTWEVNTSLDADELGGWGYSVDGQLGIRPQERWELSLQPGYSRALDPRQFIDDQAGGPAATFGTRYIFAFVDQSELSMQLRLNYAFTPDLSLELYAEPYAASGRFYNYGELRAARSRELRRYGTDGTTITRNDDGTFTVTDSTSPDESEFELENTDFNVRSFRSNIVLRWEWRPGSTVFLVWQRDLSSNQSQGGLVRPSGLWEALSAPGNNFFALKVSYWLLVR